MQPSQPTSPECTWLKEGIKRIGKFVCFRGRVQSKEEERGGAISQLLL